jgi:hypothetical protein
MTVPVSDTTLTTHATRSTASPHALLSYLLAGCLSVTSVNDRTGPEAAGSSRPSGSNSPNRSKVCEHHAIATEGSVISPCKGSLPIPSSYATSATCDPPRSATKRPRGTCVSNPHGSPRIPQGVQAPRPTVGHPPALEAGTGSAQAMRARCGRDQRAAVWG